MKLITVLVLAMAIFMCATIDARNVESRIVNGADTFAPFYAYLEIFQNSDFTGGLFFGGATILGQTRIITSAQNVVRFQAWKVGVGANRISDMIWRYSTDAVVHPGFNEHTLANNIAIIRFTRDQWIPLNSLTISSIPRRAGSVTLPTPGSVVYMVGFGFGHTDVQPEVLQLTQITVTTQADCELLYPHLLTNGISASYFCARNITAASNMCAGDQGGPVYEYLGTNTPVLLGVQSFNRVHNCTIPEAQPPAFLRIAWYADWINAVGIQPALVQERNLILYRDAEESI